jgi:hypothetical protein
MDGDDYMAWLLLAAVLGVTSTLAVIAAIFVVPAP